jgi:hypothetical protein
MRPHCRYRRASGITYARWRNYSGDEHLLRIGELEEVRISLEKFRDLDPQTRIIIGCRLNPTPQESARLPRDEHPPDPKNTLFSDDYTMPEGDEYTIGEA